MISQLSRWILLLLALGLSLFLVYSHKTDFHFVYQSLNTTFLIYLLLLQIPFLALSGWPFKKLMQPFGYDITWRDWVGLSFIANLMNQLLPYRPGMAFRFVYLKKRYQMLLGHFTYVSFITFAVLFVSSSLMLVTPWLLGSLDPKIYALISPSAGLIGLCLAFFVGLPFLSHHLKKRLKPHDSSWSFLDLTKVLKNHTPVFYTSMVGLLSLQLLSTLSFYLVFQVLGHSLSIGPCFFIVGLTSLAFLFPITPGNIGLLETLLGTLTEHWLGNFSIGFSAILLFRAAQFSVSLLLGTYFSFLLLGSFIPIKKSTKA